MKYKLMVAGPVNPTPSIKSLNQFPAIGHRESEFSDLYKTCKEYLFKLFDANPKDYEIIIISGSGTSAMECVISSVLQPNKRTLVISNGGFGERWKEICDIYKIPQRFQRRAGYYKVATKSFGMLGTYGRIEAA